jgi:hypothetical protein
MPPPAAPGPRCYPAGVRCVAPVLALLLAAPGARAQDGGLPEECFDDEVLVPQEVFPAVNAQQVNLDAPLRVRYTAGTFEELPGLSPRSLLTVVRCADPDGFDPCLADPEEPVPGLVQVLGDELVFLPDGGWQPESRYSGLARGPDGEDLLLGFRTGVSLDVDPPSWPRSFDVLTEPTSTPREDGPCGEVGGFRIATSFEPARDDGPAASIEYLLFQIAGAGLEAPRLRARLRSFPTASVPMAFVLPPSEAGSPISIQVWAVDGVGRVARSEVEEVYPLQGNFFEALCSVGAPGRDRGAPLWPLAAVGVGAAWWARRRARRR